MILEERALLMKAEKPHIAVHSERINFMAHVVEQFTCCGAVHML